MANQHFTFASLEDLHKFYHDLPEGSTASGIASDLEAGNIDEFTVQFPGETGKVVEVSYIGPVAEGYVSPFETQHEESEL
jgi:hypothetical protein